MRIADAIRNRIADRKDRRDWAAFQRRPWSPPPHVYKVHTVLDLARRWSIRTLVETGTFEGEMARKCRHAFRAIYTIELDPVLARRATARLSPYRNIAVLQGDSGECLPRLLQSLGERVLFWLDGHYSGGRTIRGAKETPLLEELDAIRRFGSGRDVILIDDARLLGTREYPDTGEVRGRLLSIDPNSRIHTAWDILRCEPGAGP